ncbi:MAG: lasso peptide biosynthesis B2 protein [Actinomycetota bacterium]|nr:lasso peptide biosynthesis B2 protein [Actinomycetota bacterium]
MPGPLRYEYATVLALAGVAEVALRFVPLRKIARLYRVSFDARAAAGPPLDALPPWAATRVRVVRVVMGKWPIEGVCLREALVTGQRLRRLRPALKLGVARSETGVAAHAWVEIAGRSLDPTSSRYAMLPSP